mgnify:CR=1 FL=1
MKSIPLLSVIGAITWWSLWFTPDQQAQRLMNRGEFQAAAETTVGVAIPYRGSWLQFEADSKNTLGVRLDRREPA